MELSAGAQEILNTLKLKIPDGILSTIEPRDEKAAQRFKIECYNNTSGNLEYYDCPICKNKGNVAVEIDGAVYYPDCTCVPIRRARKQIHQSGLSSLYKRCGFGTYLSDTPETEHIKERALEFLSSSGQWFFISGKAGSGKTHICTAICSELLKRGTPLRHIVWREKIRELKAMVTDREAYEKAVRTLKKVPVLYIDDFFKGGATDADLRLAYEIIDARYIDPELVTVISSEHSIESLLGIDEAIGSRIYERSKAFCLKAPDVNRRLI